jgi:hypothetical protein
MNLQNWYLIRLYKQNKMLFSFVILFIVFQIYFNNKRIHSFPFFVWDMYSRTQTLPDTLTQTEVFIDGKRLDITQLPIWEESCILNTYKMYNWMRMNNNFDPMDEVVINRTKYFPKSVYSFVSYKICNQSTEAEKYTDWLHHYLEQILHKKIKIVEIKDVQYKYLNNHFQPLNNSWSVLKSEQ